MTDDKMDVSITVEADSISNKTVTRALKVIREGDSDGFEDWELGWVLYAVNFCSNNNRPDYSQNVSGVREALVGLEDTPFDETLEEEEVGNMIDKLKEDDFVELNDEGDLITSQ